MNAALTVEGLIVVRTNVQFRSGGITFTGWIDEKVVFITQGIKSKMKSIFFFLCACSKKEIKGWMFFPLDPGKEKMTVFTQKVCRGNLCLSYFLIAKHVIRYLFGGPRKKEKNSLKLHQSESNTSRLQGQVCEWGQDSAFNIGTSTLVNVRASLWGLTRGFGTKEAEEKEGGAQTSTPTSTVVQRKMLHAKKKNP